MVAARVPKRDRANLAKALAKLAAADVSIDCVRVPLLIEALAGHPDLAAIDAVFEQDISETNDLLIRLEGKLKHSLLGAVLEPATRDVAEIAIAQVRHDLFAQRRYPVTVRWAGELIADAKWPDGTPAWAVRPHGQLEARLRAKPIDLKPQEIALIFKYGAAGEAFRVADDGGDSEGRVRLPDGTLSDPRARRSLKALANRIGVAIRKRMKEWNGEECTLTPPTVPVSPAIDAIVRAKSSKKPKKS